MCVLMYTMIAGQFAKVYGGGMDDEAFRFTTCDAGFFITGSTWSYSQGNDDYLMLMADTLGNILWSEALGDTGGELGFAILSKGQNFLLAGGSTSYGVGDWDVFLAEVDNQGTFQWVKTYGGSRADGATFINELSDGGYLLGGGTTSWGEGGKEILIMKLDANLDVEWARAIGGAGDEGVISGVGVSDGYVLSGLSSSWGAGFDDMILIKLDSNGDLSWAKAYGGAWDDTAYTVIPVGDSLLVAGVSSSLGSGNLDIVLMKLSASGEVIWAKAYGGPEFDKVFSCKPTSDGGYLMAGATESFWGQDDDLLLIKVDHNGEVEWVRGLGGDDSDFGMDVLETDNGYAVLGGMSSYGAGEWDYFLMTLDENGDYSGCIMDTNITPVDISNITITELSPGFLDITDSLIGIDTTLEARSVTLESSDVCPPAVQESAGEPSRKQVQVLYSSNGVIFRSDILVPLYLYASDGRLLKISAIVPGDNRVMLSHGVYFWKAGSYSGTFVIR